MLFIITENRISVCPERRRMSAQILDHMRDAGIMLDLGQGLDGLRGRLEGG